ncbi:MAG: hypothetical protein HC888_07630 [Candidatus Competibacteraceae bacterium]|nr:hypothetical protein [Candidatus Competibacteraceae bacterium]
MSFLQGTKRTAISTSYVCLLAGLCITLQIQATGFCRAGAVGVAVAFDSPGKAELVKVISRWFNCGK